MVQPTILNAGVSTVRLKLRLYMHTTKAGVAAAVAANSTVTCNAHLKGVRMQLCKCLHSALTYSSVQKNLYRLLRSYSRTTSNSNETCIHISVAALRSNIISVVSGLSLAHGILIFSVTATCLA